MKGFFTTFLFLVALGGLVTTANASTVYNSSLDEPPGFFAGSGNPNEAFAVLTDGNLQMGLAINERFVGSITPTGGNIYQVDPGPGAGGWSKGGIHWSVNTQASGGSDTLNDFIFTLQAVNITAGIPGPAFSPLLIPDNECWNSGGEVAAGSCNPATDYAAQNTSNLSWILPGFDVDDEALYQIILTATPVGGGDTLRLDVFQRVGSPAEVPEPATMLLFSSALIGFGYLRRKKQQIS